MSESKQITVEDMEALAKEMLELRTALDSAKELVSEYNKQLAELEGKAVGYLKELGKNSYKSEFGTISRVEKWRVNLPQGEDKLKVFAYLKERDLFEKMATMNANTWNSFYMQEWEAAKEADPEAALTFSIPGAPEPKLFEDISFRRK